MKKRNQNKETKQTPIRKNSAPKRILIRESGKLPEGAIKARIIAAQGRFFYALDQSGEKYECLPAGKIISPNLRQTIIAVGDNVHILPDLNYDEASDFPGASIVEVGLRKSMLSRVAIHGGHTEHVIAANIDNLVIMAPLLSPDLNRRLIDRYLVAAEIGKIKPIIAVNKIDLVQGMNVQDILQPYHDLGITILYMSALYGEGIKPLEEHLKDKTSVFSGQSGAGKSTLVNSLLGEQVQVVSEISDKSNKGRHTTSFVAEFDLPFGGTVIDTPGIREFALAGVDKQNLPLYFHEFDDFMLNCKYKPCSHTHEPNCAVAEAVENGEIDYDRYESYIYLYESLSD